MAIDVVKYVPSLRFFRNTMTRSPGVYVAESEMNVNRDPAAPPISLTVIFPVAVPLSVCSTSSR